MFTGEYIPPTLVVDSIVFELIDNTLNVLLIQRTQEPFKGTWALPGGYCAAGETTRDAMDRILKAKAGIEADKLQYIEQLFTFDTVARVPRGHAVSVSYMGLSRSGQPTVSKTTQNPKFFPVDQLPKLAYDHAGIIKYAHERLRAKITYTNAVFALLPKKFTLTQLQLAYEAILGHELDKRNFRKKFQELNLISPTNEYFREGAHRPAKLYKFNKQSLEILMRSFD
jgi:8-oxo-dGTP diphosphatase